MKLKQLFEIQSTVPFERDLEAKLSPYFDGLPISRFGDNKWDISSADLIKNVRSIIKPIINKHSKGLGLKLKVSVVTDNDPTYSVSGHASGRFTRDREYLGTEIKIEISKILVSDAIRNTSQVMGIETRSHLKSELVKTVAHEILHLHQHSKSEQKSLFHSLKRQQSNKLSSQEAYYGDPVERSAFAANIAYDLVRNAPRGQTVLFLKQALQDIKTMGELEFNKKYAFSFKMYDIFNSTDPRKQKVWRKLLKDIYVHIIDKTEQPQ